MPFLKKHKLRRIAIAAGVTAAAIPLTFSTIREPRNVKALGRMHWPRPVIERTLAETEKRIFAKYPGFQLNPKLAKVLGQPENVAINSFAKSECDKNGINYNFWWATIRRESFWNPLAKSKKNARGISQLTPITLKELRLRGMKVDPFNPTQAVSGSVELMKIHIQRLEKMKFYHNSRIVSYKDLPEYIKFGLQAEAYLNGITDMFDVSKSALREKKDASKLINSYGKTILAFMREKEAYDLLIPIYRLASA